MNSFRSAPICKDFAARRKNTGTLGYKRRVSLKQHSRYFSSGRSWRVHGRSESPNTLISSSWTRSYSFESLNWWFSTFLDIYLAIGIGCHTVEEPVHGSCSRIMSLRMKSFFKWSIWMSFFWFTSNMKVLTSSLMSSSLRTVPLVDASNSRSRNGLLFS